LIPPFPHDKTHKDTLGGPVHGSRLTSVLLALAAVVHH
jgi:hypothetical protein